MAIGSIARASFRQLPDANNYPRGVGVLDSKTSGGDGAHIAEMRWNDMFGRYVTTNKVVYTTSGFSESSSRL
jgi:hypothetical protein